MIKTHAYVGHTLQAVVGVTNIDQHTWSHQRTNASRAETLSEQPNVRQASGFFLGKCSV